MKRSGIGIISLNCFLIIVGGVYLSSNKSNQEAAVIASNENEINEIENISRKIEETKLLKQVLEELKEKGYTPTGNLQLTIYSPEKKLMAITMSDIQSRKKQTEKDIQEIVNQLSKQNKLGIFEVRIHD